MSIPPQPQKEAETTLLAAREIVKRFGELVAVDHVDIEIGPGIHALLGENGAGKSTLVRTLYGYHRADEGEIFLDGRRVEINKPADAKRAEIGLVFQQFTLIPALTVTENIALFLPHVAAVLNYKKLAAWIREMAERYALGVDPTPRVGALSLPEQQRVEILRVLLAGARVLILDEPTSTLPAQEIDALFDVLRRLRDNGYPIVLITHKMPEVFAVADTVTVMRRGAVVATAAITTVNEKQLVEMMFGGMPPTVSRVASHATCSSRTAPVLQLNKVFSAGTGRPLTDLDLVIARGEIVGVAGVAGNGQLELADAIIGLARITKGTRLLDGRDTTRWDVRHIRDAGVSFVPENVLGQQLIWNMSLEENLVLGSINRFSRRYGFSLDRGRARADWAKGLTAFQFKLPNPTTRAGTLSGGNAQRFVIARELARRPRLLVVLYPTRELDAPTAATVRQLLLDVRDAGCGILLISQDLDELTALSDRLLVMRDGRIVAELASNTNPYEIGAWMTGGTAFQRGGGQ